MNLVKIGAIILILTAGLVGSYLIVRNSKTNDLGNYVSIIESSGKAAGIAEKSPIQWVEKARDFISDPVKSLEKISGENFSETLKKTDPNDSSSNNLTDFVAKTVGGQIQYLSQGGKDFDPNDSKNQEMIKKAMTDLSSAPLFEGTINDKDLKISQDNSKEAKIKYLTETAQVIINNSNGIYKNIQKALERLVNNLDVSGVSQIADAYSKILDGFLNTQIPSDYLDLHKRYIILLKKAKETYLGLADYSNDPVRAGLSMQMIPKIFEAESEIQQEYYQKSLNIK